MSLCLYDILDQSTSYFNQAQLLTVNLNGTYNIICFLIAFEMISITRKFGAKQFHFISQAISGFAILVKPFCMAQLFFLLFQILLDQALQSLKYICFL